MSSRNKSATLKGNAKGVSRQRPSKDEDHKSPLGDPKKKPYVGGKTMEVRPKQAPVSNGPSVQQKTQVTTTSWVKGGSSLSFVDVVRKRAENAAVATSPPEPVEDAVTVHMEEEVVDMMPDVHEEEHINVQTLNTEAEDITYDAMQHDAAIVQAVMPAPPEEELEETPAVVYYVLEIDRIVEESILLPPRATAIGVENDGVYTFSGQAGKPPTPVQQQFYRPETTAPRTFGAVGGTSDINRNSHWGQQPGHSAEYAGLSWALQDRNQRSFHQGMQYNSYAPPVQQQQQQQQQQQRNFIPQVVNRMRQNDMPEASLRALRDPGAFNRHPGNGGGVW
ncbi:hypothetical protein DQ04_04041040 [Trypanosoma grayi]|uniref:hypothetical protein n=1 Tax=Trypanosoma grayi TaxID=71804 RepID=UPI0004F4B9A9|nr:hypothetical protein DQ04_04041040 [Trypanosoma grayi]KEG10212.1 hypothetical protein DQ04_04041040 [Trypanosoma grayi]